MYRLLRKICYFKLLNTFQGLENNDRNKKVTF